MSGEWFIVLVIVLIIIVCVVDMGVITRKGRK